jgi:ribonuclease HI
MSQAPTHVEIFTDGGCSPNPGAGAWAALLRFGSVEKEISGFEPQTTNNRMELTAAIRALQSLKRACRVELYTDSQYLRQGITSWVKNWQQRNWRTGANKPVLNQDLWQELLQCSAPHSVQWHWVRGHDGHAENERVDALVQHTMKSHMQAAALTSTPNKDARKRA